MKTKNFCIFLLLVLIILISKQSFSNYNYYQLPADYSKFYNPPADTGGVNLCEQFSSNIIPAGWTLVYSGTLYIYRTTQSAFGLGTGSILFDMWDAPNGTFQQLLTPTLTPTSSGDSLVVDFAYCPAVVAPDSLIISISTNGGTTFTSYLRLAANQIGAQHQCSSPFVPGPNDWRKNTYSLPVGTNKISFGMKSGFGDNLYMDSVCIKSGLIGVIHNLNNVPTEYFLSQNYPNPFNPSTMISYGLPKAGTVNIIIYDAGGREIETIENGFKQAGSYSINFNAVNLASGVYFYTIKANGYSETKKMLLIK